MNFDRLIASGGAQIFIKFDPDRCASECRVVLSIFLRNSMASEEFDPRRSRKGLGVVGIGSRILSPGLQHIPDRKFVVVELVSSSARQWRVLHSEQTTSRFPRSWTLMSWDRGLRPEAKRK
jgi:hypothetical protein